MATGHFHVSGHPILLLNVPDALEVVLVDGLPSVAVHGAVLQAVGPKHRRVLRVPHTVILCVGSSSLLLFVTQSELVHSRGGLEAATTGLHHVELSGLTVSLHQDYRGCDVVCPESW